MSEPTHDAGGFSVLMSLYERETASNFASCMESLLAQTVLPDEIVVVLDGPISESVRALLDGYVRDHPSLVRVVAFEENRGLGAALHDGVIACNRDLIARMDTDDIAVPHRFATQVAEFESDPELDICGSHVDEFETDPSVIVACRRVPLAHADIVRYQRRRDAFNHMTVMYKRDAVLRAGNYQPCPLMEDTLLWVNMLQSGAKAKNVDESLVLVRIGEDMYQRRGGLSYFKKYLNGRRRVYQTGFITRVDYLYTIAVQLVVCLIPNGLRGTVFRRILHR